MTADDLIDRLREMGWLGEYGSFAVTVSDAENLYFRIHYTDYHGGLWDVPVQFYGDEFSIDLGRDSEESMKLDPENYWSYLFHEALDRKSKEAK